jgi:DNA polymerase-3 subunit delta'
MFLFIKSIMKFSDVVGQHALKKQLIQTVKENRVSHAQMFAGLEGAGSLPLALAYAQYICCENPAGDDSCGTCKSCQKYSKLIHPDLHFVFPVVNQPPSIPKATSDDYIIAWREALLENPYMNLNIWVERIASENKQAGIFEKESGEIIRKLNLKTYESDFKVMIIWMPEKMNVTTANKLLKMIEEPPPKTLFLLVSDSQSQILPTIMSRVQFIKIPPIAKAEMGEALSKILTDPERVQEIVRVAAGNYLKAMEMIGSHDEDKEFLDFFINLMRLSYSRNVPDLIKWAEGLASIGREKQKKFLNISLRMVRENFTMNVTGQTVVYMNDMEMNFSKKFYPFINETNIYQINEEFNKAVYHIEANGNAKIIFLDLALKMVKLIRP